MNTTDREVQASGHHDDDEDMNIEKTLAHEVQQTRGEPVLCSAFTAVITLSIRGDG